MKAEPRFRILENLHMADNSMVADVTKLKRRDRNREAAYKSRKKHTERADTLHQEFEKLEKDNAALRKEIEYLQQETTRWSLVLKKHEATCLLGSPDIVAVLLHDSDPLWSPQETQPVSNF
ncbi:basic leucine zipper transcriptional factor ATF-like 2 [Spea bombifrons]|uniref:basic leucine zipper transcriptional factor ATF-like 2 n=1 Tax=Spea bombifrons TaxID=233779 RepID=UPI00234BC7DB|nr:basic leucine zipper transcriptional factor ATF-like 2 [Spea bombifrons]